MNPSYQTTPSHHHLLNEDQPQKVELLKATDTTVAIDSNNPPLKNAPLPPIEEKSGSAAIDSYRRAAGKAASKCGRHFEKHSSLVTKRRCHAAELRWRDIVIGQQLGIGAFSHVYEAILTEKYIKSPRFQGFPAVDNDATKKMRPSEESEDDVVQHQLNRKFSSLNIVGQIGDKNHGDDDGDDQDQKKRQRRQLKKQPIIRRTAGTNPEEERVQKLKRRKFALKCLDPEQLNDDFTDSAIDLIMEAKLLSCLSHQNIVTLYAVTAGSVSKIFTKKGYFLLLDRLVGTLDDTLRHWSKHAKNIPPIRDRLQSVALGIVAGCQYLHNQKIIFRDLKPSNVGFGSDGRIKIFDFGLAREVINDGKRMTGYTGSARYMAPEVARSEDYSFPADCYSFGILLWEVLSLSKAFKGMTKDQHMELVVCSRLRPKLSAIMGGNASVSVKRLIQAAWHHRPTKRPTFEEMGQVLQQELFPPPPPMTSGGASVKRARSLSRVRRRLSLIDRQGSSASGR